MAEQNPPRGRRPGDATVKGGATALAEVRLREFSPATLAARAVQNPLEKNPTSGIDNNNSPWGGFLLSHDGTAETRVSSPR